ncbi:MAG: excinuclease ABC subunit UvrA [Bacteroidota bacterium]|nr:excinuclease ABC subunit UvrA [Bacteroidota bacterium]
MKQDKVSVIGAREHNLRNIDIEIPRNQLTVITGLSGSGKSSLAFDTIYAEGQRRYIDTFSAYARRFLGNIDRPDVDKITGLSPVISIEQKTVNKNPRSTVGTVTETYDFLRLLFARSAKAYSKETGEEMVQYTQAQILDLITEEYYGKKILILAPMVKSRKGHYRELFVNIRKKGYIQAQIDGEIRELIPNLKLDRYKNHNIEVVVDKLAVNDDNQKRLKKSVETALKLGKNVLLLKDYESEQTRYFSKNLMCPTTGISYDEPAPNSFSFNSPQGACPTCNGTGSVARPAVDKIIQNKNKSIEKGAILPLGKPKKHSMIFRQAEAVLQEAGLGLAVPVKDIPEPVMEKILYGTKEPVKIKHPSLGKGSEISLSFDGIIPYLERMAENKSSKARRLKRNYFSDNDCPACKGRRLKEDALWFRFAGKNIVELADKDISELIDFLKKAKTRISAKQKKIAAEILKELITRLQFLDDVGLSYLNLNRRSRSLSGGESQRIRLASQIGSKLVNVLYILDEPSIGLHQRDNHRLINSLMQLRDTGNSVIVVEHDKEMMMAADYIVDMGPGAGRHGGEVTAKGTPEEILQKDSLTSSYLNGEKKIEIPEKLRNGSKEKIILRGATGNNLKGVKMVLPLGKFICVTGVSGSGKSSLINGTLHPILSAHFYNSIKKPLPFQDISGIEYIDKVIEVNQSPIGRTPRSNPATYTKVFDEIRKIFAKLPESKIRGYKVGRFSFNVKGGRCEACQGAGVKTIEMNFLPDVYVHCEDCRGMRYNRETLEVRYKGKSISDVLNLSINKAHDFFDSVPKIRKTLKALKDVGLGYITLGQPSTTLSGGEAQRVKLATELAKRDTGKTLYILDEPTTGLHFEDIRMLLDVLNKLTDKGNTVIVIEHNMDVIKVADHIIDLGQEGGIKGGNILVEGTPKEVVKNTKSYTAEFLRKEMHWG